MIVRRARRLALRAADTKALDLAVSVFQRRLPPAKQTLAVLTYHRVDTSDRRSDLHPGLISATPEQFERQMRCLQPFVNFISIEQLVGWYRNGRPLPERPVLITFDDATDDFGRFAWPILQRNKIPATVFVATDFVDQRQRGFWWDRLYHALHHGTAGSLQADAGTFRLHSRQAADKAFRQISAAFKRMHHSEAMRMIDDICRQQQVSEPGPSVMTWRDIEDLSQQGVTFAAHSCSHPLLTHVDVATATAEAVQSRHVLADHLANVPPVIAYPGGDVNEQVATAIRDAGFELGFTTQRGINDLRDSDRMLLRRINVGQATTPRLLRAQLVALWWRTR